jgi:hypothetical protein
MMHDPVEGHLAKRAADEIIPDQNSKGWKSDAKKNIPGYKVLYEKFPNADWYIMIDDDTYLFMDNLKEKLDQYNPLDPVYLGAPTNFIGCDGVKEWGKSIYFAHGGSGIVLSRGAVLKMLPLIENCITKYDNCWAGDIRLSLCLRDAGILVKNGGYFSPDAPNDRFNYSFPCATPRTFHHLLSHQIQTLYELDQVAQSKSEKVYLDDIFKTFLNDEVRIGYDRPGGYIKMVKKSTAEDCNAECQSNTKCVAYTYGS